jgi:HPt (histidine-containing phosphotransfer) domain-containing protein
MSENERSAPLVDPEFIEQIRQIEQATGRDDVLSGFIRMLEDDLAGFDTAFSAQLERKDAAGAARVAHTLKGTCRQLGAQALGDLFADIETCAKSGDYVTAKQKFAAGASIIARSLHALKRA